MNTLHISRIFLLILLVTNSHTSPSPQNTAKQYAIPNCYEYSPWRDDYYAPPLAIPAYRGCPFCYQIETSEAGRFHTLYRGKNCFIKLNDFPYTKGHIMILPYEHIGQLDKLSPETGLEIMQLTVKSVAILKETFDCSGFHVGFNLGKHSGASIPDHLHLQIVPRYKRNIGFMQTIGQTTLIGYDIEKVYEMLLPKFQKMN